MQPFAIPKVPKVSVPNRKQPPVHRYPAPTGLAQPGILNSGDPTQLKSHNQPFAEDITKAPFEATQHHQQFTGSEYNERNFFETREELAQNDFQIHNRGPSFEETPAVFKGQSADKLLQENTIAGKNRNDESEVHISNNAHSQHIISSGPPNPQVKFHNKFESPAKRAIGTKDDDEYVRMASADEEEEEGLEIEHNNENLTALHERTNNLVEVDEKPDVSGRYKEDIIKSISRTKTPNVTMIEDTNLLLKLKRTDLELAKEKKRADFLESEQEKLIHENAELRKRIEELNARADLMKKYDYSERFARKEEETERLKLEVQKLRDENRIINTHAQRILQENNEYKNESEILIISLQEEKRRMQEELQLFKRENEGRTNSKVERITERNQILENQLAELRHQISVLTDQLTRKNETELRISSVSEGIQSLVSSFSKVTDYTQAHPAALQTSESQTSPTRLPHQNIPRNTIDTQTLRVIHESQFSQTSPIKVQPHISTEVQTSTHPFIQTATQTHATHLHSQVAQTSPIQINQKAFISPDRLHPSPKLQMQEDYQLTPKEEDQIIINQEEEPQQNHVFDNLAHANELEIASERAHRGSDHVPHLEEPLHTHATTTEQISHINPEQPKIIHPPSINPSHHMPGPPKFKVPVGQIPKKPVIGFKPTVPHYDPFSQKEEHTHIESPEKHDKISSPHVDNETQGPPVNVDHSTHNYLESFNVNAEEIPPPPTQTESANLLHNRGLIHSEPKEEQLSSDLNNKQLGLTEKIEEPPKSLPPQMKTVEHGTFVSATNRPPLFNAHHNKPKVHKIGKNPFANETQNDVSSLFGASVVSESFNEQSNITDLSQSHDVTRTTQQSLESRDKPVHLQQTHHKEDDKTSATAENFFDQLGSGQHHQHQEHKDIAPPSRYGVMEPQQSEQTSATAAENFFDQLGSGQHHQHQEHIAPPPRYEVREPQQNVNWGSNENIKQSFMQEETHDLTKSFQSEVNSQSAQVKPPQHFVGKTIPIVKKKKGALPSNMFD